MKYLIERWKNWRRKRRRLAFESLADDPASGVPQMIQQRAQAAAMQMVTTWLDHKRIKHCTECPATDTLRNDQGVYLCEPHYYRRQALRERDQQHKALKEEVQIG